MSTVHGLDERSDLLNVFLIDQHTYRGPVSNIGQALNSNSGVNYGKRSCLLHFNASSSHGGFADDLDRDSLFRGYQSGCVLRLDSGPPTLPHPDP